ncbi:DUF2130 domain-containing protein [Candidatus Saccharibacteria bacterium]|nr:DUF2130 domain-containing protein [Candidatus Saccharibacteria bacterium]
MNTIKCPNCGQAIEISEALQGQIEAQVLAAEHAKHQTELDQVRAESASEAKRATEAAKVAAQRQLDGEKKLLEEQAAADLELAKTRLQADIANQQRQSAAENELAIKRAQDDAAAEKLASSKLRDQLSEIMTELRAERQAKENAQLEAQKKLAEDESQIRETATREADERHRLDEAAKDKRIADMQRALDEAQRKGAQGSQQLQGEIMELDFEGALATAFRDDLVEPIAKGVRGGDIRQTVRSGQGTVCGVMLWEIKRTKNWTEGWIGKLKEDLRSEKANIPIIVTEAMPKDSAQDIMNHEGVWICKPALAVVLGTLLRKSLLDVGRQKALDANRTTNAEALYNFVTSHEFVQQIEVMVETYRDMNEQVTKERVAFEKLWAQREKQAQRLLLGTANIIGSMQGQIGQASMPRIKGLELGDGEESDISRLI